MADRKTRGPSAATKITAVYPGSFDPITLGHQDIIGRSSRMFAQVIVALSESTRNKQFAFDTHERLAMIEKVVKPFSNVRVVPFTGLLTQFVRSANGTVIIRGLRAISDFEYEFQMASMNHTLAPDVETVFMMTATKHSYLSSSIVKEIALLNGDISHLVPASVHRDIIARLRPVDDTGGGTDSAGGRRGRGARRTRSLPDGPVQPRRSAFDGNH